MINRAECKLKQLEHLQLELEREREREKKKERDGERRKEAVRIYF